MSILWFLIIGVLAGWIAGQLYKGRGFGLVGNLIIGVIGAVLGGFIFDLLGVVAFGLLGKLVMSVIGALVLLFVVQTLKKA
jgi:uncharacterized membrane protein YeaQ/YmgE (transglycosylase-associated protein family)